MYKRQVQELFPGKSDWEIGEPVPKYFVSAKHDAGEEKIERYQVAAILKSIKIPKSVVKGDITPTLVTKFSDILTIPLTDIFNQVIKQWEWPDLWRRETIVVIPKKSSPESLAECRNLSCTPLFSKALETIVLKRLKEETRFRASQYGGQKGCGADNFLVQTWQEIVYGLEGDQACTNLISLDFEKAFNRMAHRHCLVALREHGASNFSIRMARAFLLERHMQVRIGDTLSPPENINGGSPQGSILGNYMFDLI